MSKEQLRHTVFYDDDTEAKLDKLRKTGKPVLMLIPHTCLFETLATSPFLDHRENVSWVRFTAPIKTRPWINGLQMQGVMLGSFHFQEKKALLRLDPT